MPYHQALEALIAASQEKTLVRAMSGVTARYHEASGAGARCAYALAKASQGRRSAV